MNPEATIRRRQRWLAGSLLVVAGVVTSMRVLVVGRLADRGFFVKYIQFADAIIAGRIPRARLGDVSPGYLWTTVALRGLGAAPHDVIVLQIVAVTIAALCLSFCAWRIRGPIAALGAAVVLLGNRAALVCATELEPETLILLSSAIGLAALAASSAGYPGGPDRGSAAAKPSRSILLLAGLAFGISAICRPVALLVIAGLAVWLWLRTRSAVVWFIAAAAIPIVVVLAVNWRLSGEALIMDPGTVFYEGMNPLATGYAGVQPRIVNDLETISPEPDFLHVAYRIVAARATGSPMNRSASNHYWSGRAWCFARREPATAIRLTLRKFVLACQSYDAYDLSTMARKSDALSGFPWLPFGFVLALSIAALLMQDRASVERRPLRPPPGGWRGNLGPEWAENLGPTRDSSAEPAPQKASVSMTPVVIFTLANAVTPVAFYVTARVRNALVPGMAVLAGAGIAMLLDVARTERRRAIIIAALILTSALILGIEGEGQTEDRYGWTAAARSGEAGRAAEAADSRGSAREAAVLRAIAATWRPAEPNAVDHRLLAAVARGQLARESRPERRFDLAVALQSAGDGPSSAKVLGELAAGGYRPRRENRAVSSVAFYQARAALRSGSLELARQHLAAAAVEAPGDPYVLALRMMLERASSTAIAAGGELRELHDPFTGSLAMASARADLGDRTGASVVLGALIRTFPEWPRPRAVAAAMR